MSIGNLLSFKLISLANLQQSSCTTAIPYKLEAMVYYDLGSALTLFLTVAPNRKG